MKAKITKVRAAAGIIADSNVIEFTVGPQSYDVVISPGQNIKSRMRQVIKQDIKARYRIAAARVELEKLKKLEGQEIDLGTI